jgi:hypothetical protein
VCTAIAVDALAVSVLDAATGQRICDANVVAADGSFRAELRAFGTPQECLYSGPTEQAGRYDVRASRSGYETGTLSGVRVTADECHVIPVKVTIQLKPAASLSGIPCYRSRPVRASYSSRRGHPWSAPAGERLRHVLECYRFDMFWNG